MPPDNEAIAEQVFVGLADPTRRSILAALAAGGPATATDLAARLPITRQAIAKHLTLLADPRPRADRLRLVVTRNKVTVSSSGRGR
jgi:DNA-binding transcriptional ArsR family regulator